MLAADTLCSYGTLAMFKDVNRICKMSDTTLVGAGGEFSDFQYITHMLEDLNGACVRACLCVEQVGRGGWAHKPPPCLHRTLISSLWYTHLPHTCPLAHSTHPHTDNDRNMDDGYTHSPSEVYHYLRAVMYQRRNKVHITRACVSVGVLVFVCHYLRGVNAPASQHNTAYTVDARTRTNVARAHKHFHMRIY